MGLVQERLREFGIGREGFAAENEAVLAK